MPEVGGTQHELKNKERHDTKPMQTVTNNDNRQGHRKHRKQVEGRNAHTVRYSTQNSALIQHQFGN
jgi:hypothetical protein